MKLKTKEVDPHTTEILIMVLLILPTKNMEDMSDKISQLKNMTLLRINLKFVKG